MWQQGYPQIDITDLSSNSANRVELDGRAHQMARNAKAVTIEASLTVHLEAPQNPMYFHAGDWAELRADAEHGMLPAGRHATRIMAPGMGCQSTRCGDRDSTIRDRRRQVGVIMAGPRGYLDWTPMGDPTRILGQELAELQRRMIERERPGAAQRHRLPAQLAAAEQDVDTAQATADKSVKDADVAYWYADSAAVSVRAAQATANAAQESANAARSVADDAWNRAANAQGSANSAWKYADDLSG